MSEPYEWKVLENVKNPICPLISAHTVKQANKYIECLKEKCMWWNRCTELGEPRQHGKWDGEQKKKNMVTRICTSCGARGAVGYFCMWCGANTIESGKDD